jgi:tetratricopeptide (TPR) repeat protein
LPIYKWQPPHQNSRIIAQQSIFLFGTVEINPNKECILLGSRKQEIRESLQQLHGITEAMLFPDFEGFARVHRQGIPYIQLAASQYRKQGLQKINERKYKEAIAAFTEAIKVNPGESSDHQNRGAAKEMLLSQSRAESHNEYKGVLDDYTEAIRLDPNAPVTYYQRGC